MNRRPSGLELSKAITGFLQHEAAEAHTQALNRA